MRNINLIVIHCSATRCNQPFPVTSLIACHDARFGFTGYHYYITRDGKVYQTRHENLVGAHVKNYNRHSLGVCYEGGLNEDKDFGYVTNADIVGVAAQKLPFLGYPTLWMRSWFHR